MFDRKLEKWIFHGRIVESILSLSAILGVFYSLYYVFMVVPNERVMGAVQRIFYFHVGSAMSCYVMIAVLLAGSISYLATKRTFWDQLAEAGGVTALLFCTIVLLSGMIWGHSAWNVWWRWEPRLVSFLVLWLILLGYVILRGVLKDDERLPSFASVLGILAAVNVPIVIFSIRLLAPTEQLHPEVVANQGLKDPRFVYALIMSNLSAIAMSLFLLLQRLRLAVLTSRMRELERKLS